MQGILRKQVKAELDTITGLVHDARENLHDDDDGEAAERIIQSIKAQADRALETLRKYQDARTCDDGEGV
jgi:hypothetical protein